MDFVFIGAEVGFLRRCTQCRYEWRDGHTRERYPCIRCGSMYSERIMISYDKEDIPYDE